MIYIICGIVFVWLIILSVFLVCKEKKNKKLIEELKTDIESNNKNISRDIDLLQKDNVKLSQLLLEEYLNKFKVGDKVKLKDIKTLKRLSVEIEHKEKDGTDSVTYCSIFNPFAPMRLFFEYSEDRIFTIKEIKDNAIYFDSYENIPISPEWLEKVKKNNKKIVD